MPCPPLYLGIDLGTSGCRMITIDPHGQVIAQAVSPLPVSLRQGATVSQRPEDWWQAIENTFVSLHRSLRQVGHSPRSIKAIAIDSTSGSLLLCDANGRPITPALMYDDQRPVEIVKMIKQNGPCDGLVENTGSALAKLLWWHQTGVTKSAHHALHPADWLSGNFTARFGISDYNNALKLGYDVIHRQWPDWVTRLGFNPRLLPEVVEPGQTVGRISPSIAMRFGLSDTVEIVAGTTDSVAAVMASGADQVGDGVTALGTTLVLKLLSKMPITNASSGIYSHRLGSYWLIGGASNSGGAAIARYFSLDEVKQLSEKIDPMQASGLNYYPLPATGERFPIADRDLKSRVQPIPDESSLFLHGLLEGVASIEALGYQRLKEQGGPQLKRLFASGGGSHNQAWRKIRERKIGLTITASRHDQPAYGVALLAHHRCNSTG